MDLVTHLQVHTGPVWWCRDTEMNHTWFMTLEVGWQQGVVRS